jgi:hypothetical protein
LAEPPTITVCQQPCKKVVQRLLGGCELLLVSTAACAVLLGVALPVKPGSVACRRRHARAARDPSAASPSISRPRTSAAKLSTVKQCWSACEGQTLAAMRGCPATAMPALSPQGAASSRWVPQQGLPPHPHPHASALQVLNLSTDTIGVCSTSGCRISHLRTHPRGTCSLCNPAPMLGASSWPNSRLPAFMSALEGICSNVRQLSALCACQPRSLAPKLAGRLVHGHTCPSRS